LSTESPSAVSVVIPAFNEARTIGTIVATVKALPAGHEVVVVDDGSTDGTAEAARAAGATVLRHPYNIGYGASVRKGIRGATRPIVVLMDADDQHDPEDIDRLVRSLEGYDMVVAARPWKARGRFIRAAAITVLSWLASSVAGRRIPDLTSGLRAFRREVALRYASLLPTGFSASSTMTLVLLQAGHPVLFVPGRVRPRAAGESKVRPLRDGLKSILTILRLVALLTPLRVFLPPSLVLILFGALRLLVGFCGGPTGVDGHASLFTGILLFFFGLFADHFSYIRRLPRSDD
jgi:glycosyltransferase involved in cell wall biosynthesis